MFLNSRLVPYLAATLLPLLVVIAAVALLIIAVINSAYIVTIGWLLRLTKIEKTKKNRTQLRTLKIFFNISRRSTFQRSDQAKLVIEARSRKIHRANEDNFGRTKIKDGEHANYLLIVRLHDDDDDGLMGHNPIY
uniref:Uncharacterized protein n=1 Tax=Glossina pallidipes TaxID=7398 RepID=A0A1B0A250_GLOPL